MKFTKLFCLFAGTITMAGCDDASYKPANESGRFDFNLYSQTTGTSASVCAVSTVPVESYSITLNGVTSNGQCVSIKFAEPGVYSAQATLKYNGESVSKSISVNVQPATGTFASRKSAYGPILEAKASSQSSSDGGLSMEDMFGGADDSASADDKKADDQQTAKEVKKQEAQKPADKPLEENKKANSTPASGGYSMPAFLQNGTFDEDPPKDSDSSNTAETKKESSSDDKKVAEVSSNKTDGEVGENKKEDKAASADEEKSGEASKTDSGNDANEAEKENTAGDEKKDSSAAAVQWEECYFSSTGNAWGFEKMAYDPETGTCSLDIQFSGSGDENGPQRFKITDAADWNHRVFGQSFSAANGLCDVPGTCLDIEFAQAGSFKLVINTKDMTWSLTGEDGKTYPVVGDDANQSPDGTKKDAEGADQNAADSGSSAGGESEASDNAPGADKQDSSSDTENKSAESSSDQKSDAGSEEEKKDDGAAADDKKDENSASDDKKDESAADDGNKDETSGSDASAGSDDSGSSDESGDDDIGLDSLSW